MASAFASDAKTYMDLSGADNMMKDMMTAVVMHKPEDPVDFLIDWLREEKTTFPESGETGAVTGEKKDSPAA